GSRSTPPPTTSSAPTRHRCGGRCCGARAASSRWWPRSHLTRRSTDAVPSGAMFDLDQMQALAAIERGLVVVSTARRDGTIQSSVVNAGVMDHPVDGAPVVALVA